MTKQDPKFLEFLVRDDNNQVVQIGSSFQTTDATNTPLESPLAYSNTIIEIKVPDRAVEMILLPSTDLFVSEDPTMTTYDLISANSKEQIPVARMESVYIVRSTNDGTLYFRFTLI